MRRDDSIFEDDEDDMDGTPGYAKDWVLVVNVGTSENYEWWDIEFYYSPSARQYFWNDQGGCSCNWWEWPRTLGEWEHGDRAAALRALTAFGGYEYAGRDRLTDTIVLRDFDEDGAGNE